ncbi:hypothetical protein COS38_02460 [Candidatus Berkelbacteria bacterium CG03_land_8_20_14_0_80_40_36]|uniref:Uncharacterized protein n=1 Tax=Candidatus Berkelbacteria bacterium CG03_land_8_20_14_0_80_40_36 TaxID=1974509 RepID=A0A2M7CI00_9BACT|nr:MAG: hypothetical protein COS38_02460 [Candidatus Berkelbacteria bacterium CG03_land_8_20_14_0_80_40_36]
MKTGIQSEWIPHQVRDDGGGGSPIRSASLSVEDDGRGWIPHQVRDDGGGGSPIRSASLSVEDDKGGSRLRMTRGYNDIFRKSCN